MSTDKPVVSDRISWPDRGGPTVGRYDCTISHTRKTPVLHRFTYRSPMWLIDVDRAPKLPRALRFLNRFDPRDHWQPGTPTLRAGIDGFLAGQGVAAPARVLLVTGARSFGHCFNPLSVYWCYDANGRQTQVVAEVHNTYHGRHAYLLQLDEAGRDTVDKEFYVSPFFAAEGRYRMQITDPGEKLSVVIALEVGGPGPLTTTPFTATMRGTRRWGGRWALLTRPLAQLRVVSLIKWEGIELWRRRVPVQPRSGSPAIEAATTGNLGAEPIAAQAQRSRS